jgi:hypothetical protein
MDWIKANPDNADFFLEEFSYDSIKNAKELYETFQEHGFSISNGVSADLINKLTREFIDSKNKA